MSKEMGDSVFGEGNAHFSDHSPMVRTWIYLVLYMIYGLHLCAGSTYTYIRTGSYVFQSFKG